MPPRDALDFNEQNLEKYSFFVLPEYIYIYLLCKKDSTEYLDKKQHPYNHKLCCLLLDMTMEHVFLKITFLDMYPFQILIVDGYNI